MLFWVAMAGLTAIVLAFVLLPVMRYSGASADRKSFDVRVFRDQLAELERDLEAGRIDVKAAQAARNEISRRILAAENDAGAGGDAPAAMSSSLAMVSIAAIPVIALSGYLMIGRPDLPDLPREARMAQAVESGDMLAMIVKVEEHLAANPNDAEGWAVLAPAYRRIGRLVDAAEAYRKAVGLSAPDARLLTEYGETLVMVHNGMVTADAREMFDKALDASAGYPKARFYRALADSQDGKAEAAIERFKSLLADSPRDAPWRVAVERQLAALSPSAKGPALDRETVSSAQQMSSEDRQQMILGMVNRLSDRLEQDGDDLDGWLRLINARMVLGQRDKAAEALAKATSQFAGNKDALARLDGMRAQHQLNAVE